MDVCMCGSMYVLVDAGEGCKRFGDRDMKMFPFNTELRGKTCEVWPQSRGKIAGLAGQDRMCFLEDFHTFSLLVRGINCPQFGGRGLQWEQRSTSGLEEEGFWEEVQRPKKPSLCAPSFPCFLTFPSSMNQKELLHPETRRNTNDSQSAPEWKLQWNQEWVESTLSPLK